MESDRPWNLTPKTWKHWKFKCVIFLAISFQFDFWIIFRKQIGQDETQLALLSLQKLETVDIRFASVIQRPFGSCRHLAVASAAAMWQSMHLSLVANIFERCALPARLRSEGDVAQPVATGGTRKTEPARSRIRMRWEGCCERLQECLSGPPAAGKKSVTVAVFVLRLGVALPSSEALLLLYRVCLSWQDYPEQTTG